MLIDMDEREAFKSYCDGSRAPWVERRLAAVAYRMLMAQPSAGAVESWPEQTPEEVMRSGSMAAAIASAEAVRPRRILDEQDLDDAIMRVEDQRSRPAKAEPINKSPDSGI